MIDRSTPPKRKVNPSTRGRLLLGIWALVSTPPTIATAVPAAIAVSLTKRMRDLLWSAHVFAGRRTFVTT
jgi:hypothetical protein